MDVQTTVQDVEKAVEGFARVEPTIATVVGMFVPGAKPIIAAVQPWAPVALAFIERALQDIATQKNGDLMAAFIELMQHVQKGAPDSPVLSSNAPQASQLGSG